MKKIYVTTTFIIMMLWPVLSAFAQAPEGFSYQAEARDSRGKTIVNKALTVKTTILIGTPGVVEWEKDYNVTTDNFGMFTIIIGDLDGNPPVTGDFSTIDWGNGTYFLNVKIFYKSVWLDQGTSQLLSVPYALYAKSAGNETDPVFTAWDKSTGISITENQISDLGPYVETETDPVFSAWDKTTGIAISEDQISDLGPYLETEAQTLGDVVALGNSANAQIKNVTNPTEAQDAATKSYVDALAQRIEELEILQGLKFRDARDGNVYKTVTIGSQVWMAENLRYLPSVVGPTTHSYTVPYYYVQYYNGTDVNEAKATDIYKTYGTLYNYPAAVLACPAGWHLPTDAEWTQLTDYLGGASTAGYKLKEAGTSHWYSSSPSVTNESGFTGLPGGYYCEIYGGVYWNLFTKGYWWSSTSGSVDATYFRSLDCWEAGVWRTYGGNSNGMSVRCIKD